MLNFKPKTSKKPAKKKSAEEIKKINRAKTAQDWMPITDIKGEVAYRKDGKVVSLIRIFPENIDLLSTREKRSRIEAIAEVLNGLDSSYEIFCIGRPVDLNAYLEWLQERAKTESDFTRKLILKEMIKDSSRRVSSGDNTERRFYFILWQDGKNKGEEELRQRIREIRTGLEQAGLKAEICQDDEILDVYTLFVNPIQAGIEKAEIYFDIPMQLED